MNQEEYKDMEQYGCDGCKDGCATANYQNANIRIPIEVKPKTLVGDITIECCEEPILECCENECRNGLDIVVTQKVCIKIPVKYQIDTCVGEDSITCC